MNTSYKTKKLSKKGLFCQSELVSDSTQIEFLPL